MEKGYLRKIIGTCILAVTAFAVTGCGTGQKELTDNNSITEEVGDYSIKIYDNYVLDEESSYQKSYASVSPLSSIIIYNDTANFCSIDICTEFFKDRIAESQEVKEENILVESDTVGDGRTCRYIEYEFDNDGKDSIACSYLLCENNSVLLISETRQGTDSEDIRYELGQMAGSASYIGEYHLPGDDSYPYYVKNDYFKMKVEQGYIDTGSVDVKGKNSVNESRLPDSVKLRLKDADDYDKALVSKLSIDVLIDQDTPVKDQAVEDYNSRLNDGDGFYDVVFDEKTLGDVWPEISDDMADISVYRLAFYSIIQDEDKDHYNFERYYFEYNDVKYMFSLSYINDDIKTRDGFMEQMYNVEILNKPNIS